ncbi:uncharacterized protein B0I36DRAFT_325944 [Microdochium trichocladiopsis]|uniref:Secreted protein n=1 Tax=Microdochium trichocladiopsis TaxID=1682393 RepID=A0A9P8Y7K5_9PEZI|nr:uncharacterized protein B0I36DRAFT_325944 [Microdochium trichocladiopsis]KAH7029527.1 hypothetical protein B0I36DRAFT_325944 [Microdochium trichocladiopsis]
MRFWPRGASLLPFASSILFPTVYQLSQQANRRTSCPTFSLYSRSTAPKACALDPKKAGKSRGTPEGGQGYRAGSATPPRLSVCLVPVWSVHTTENPSADRVLNLSLAPMMHVSLGHSYTGRHF